MRSIIEGDSPWPVRALSRAASHIESTPAQSIGSNRRRWSRSRRIASAITREASALRRGADAGGSAPAA